LLCDKRTFASIAKRSARAESSLLKLYYSAAPCSADFGNDRRRQEVAEASAQRFRFGLGSEGRKEQLFQAWHVFQSTEFAGALIKVDEEQSLNALVTLFVL